MVSVVVIMIGLVGMVGVADVDWWLGAGHSAPDGLQDADRGDEVTHRGKLHGCVCDCVRACAPVHACV